MKYTDDEYAVKGMLSKRYIPFEDFSGYRKNSKENVYFYIPDSIPTEKASFQYLSELEYNLLYSLSDWNIISKYKLSEVVLEIPEKWFDFKTGKNKEFRETWHHYLSLDNLFIVDSPKNKDDIRSFILMWDEDRGIEKYGWQRHSGYDLNFFEKYNDSNCKSLYFYIDNILVGYSVLHNYKDNQWTYIIRKADLKFRNLTLFIDEYSFWDINEGEKPVIINFGASSNGILKYKTKFPIKSIEDRYFIKVTNER